MKKILFTALATVMLVGVAIVLPLSSALALETFLAETETRLYKPDKSYNGYFMPMDHVGSTHYLMDMMGNVVHSINAKGGVPIFAPDGNLWSIGYIQDWDGNVLWEFVPTRDAPTHPEFTMHHDMKRIWNKKLKQWTQLINCNRPITQAEAAAAGADPAIATSRLVGYDFVVEVNMNKQIVWEWRPWDHTVQNVNQNWPNYVSDTKLKPGRLDINWRTDAQQPPSPGSTAGFARDWLHVNSIDYNEETDHVAINPKHFSQFIVVDHGKTFVFTTDFAQNIAKAAGSDGDIIYRFGNPSMYNQGKAPYYASEGDQQMYGVHNIQWIKPYEWDRPHAESGDKWPDPLGYTKSGVALPGAGNFLLFDNGCYNPTGKRSRLLEINGHIGASGSAEVPANQYIWPEVAGYKNTNVAYHASKQLVWSYQSSLQNSFYSSYISSVMRLPNGNTSACSGATGHLFEVMPSGEVVWEYLVPGIAGPNVKYVESDSNLAWQTDNNQYRGLAYFTFRHYRYGADFPGFAGKDLTSKGTLTGLVPRLVGEGRTKQTPSYGFGFGGSWGEGGGGGGVGSGSGGGGGY